MYRRLSMLIALALAGVLVACVPTQVQPKAPETTSAAQGLYQITDSDDTEYWPRVSWDGQYLAYLVLPNGKTKEEQQIYISKLTYNNGVSISNKIVVPFKGARDVAWRPNTNEIIFVLGNDLVLYNPFRPQGLKIIYSHEPSPGDPAFSPDGKIVAFHVFMNNRWWIVTYDMESSTLQILVPGTSPRWSRDGSKIVFDAQENGKSHIYLWDIKKSAKIQLTSGEKDIYPEFMGKRIVYQGWKDKHWYLFILEEDNTAIQLTRGDTYSYTPAWSPMGYIFFTSNVGAPPKSISPTRGLNDIWAIKVALENSEENVNISATDVVDDGDDGAAEQENRMEDGQ